MPSLHTSKAVPDSTSHRCTNRAEPSVLTLPVIIQTARNILLVCVLIHVCLSPHPLVHLDCWPLYRCLSVLQGLIKVEGLIRGCLNTPPSCALSLSVDSNWAGCQMKGLSVTQVDISGALESACECRGTLCCLCTNTHTPWVSLSRTQPSHTSDSVAITSGEQRKEREREGKKAGGSEARPFPGLVSGCDRMDMG